MAGLRDMMKGKRPNKGDTTDPTYEDSKPTKGTMKSKTKKLPMRSKKGSKVKVKSGY